MGESHPTLSRFINLAGANTIAIFPTTREPSSVMYDKVADLAGPCIGNYKELAHTLPNDYTTLLTNKETQLAIYAIKDYIGKNMCKKLNIYLIKKAHLGKVSANVWPQILKDLCAERKILVLE